MPDSAIPAEWVAKAQADLNRSFRHDVTGLLTEAIAIEPSLAAFDPRLEDFDTYNVETRYPISPPFTVTEAEVDEALATAQDLIAAISVLIYPS